jgi:tetratricopeptide (TPR) repeat protein
MKKLKLTQVAVALVAFMLISSCGIKDMLKKIDDVKFVATPNPLEMHNGKVAVSIKVDFPKDYFNPKAVVELVPYLEYEGKTKDLKKVNLQGEKVKSNFDVIKEAGGSFTYTDEFDYEPEMKVSELKLKIKAWEDGKEADAQEIPFEKILAKGVITTSELIPSAMEEDVLESSGDMFKGTAFAKVTLPEKTTIPYNATILYPVQRHTVRSSETKKEAVTKLIDNVNSATQNELTYVGTEISSYASPDGPEDLNQSLVEKRGGSAEKYIAGKLKKAKYETAVKKETTPAEDWDGFKAELEKSDIADKELILRVLSMHSDPVKREEEIKNIAEAYTDLKAKILPLLRRSEIKILFESKQRTNDQILTLAQSDAATLTEVELLHGGTVPTDLNERKKLYETMVATYGQDWRGPNNLGVVHVGLGDNAGAKAQFEKANGLDANNGIVNNNLGVMYALEGDYVKAGEFLKNATVSDPETQKIVDYNLGTVTAAQGDYDGGVSKLSGSNTISEALTKLMKGDIAGARTAIDAAKSDSGLKYYVKAVIEARDNKNDVALENLKTAISKDADLKERAITDMEFHAIRDQEAFKEIVKP